MTDADDSEESEFAWYDPSDGEDGAPEAEGDADD